MEEFEEDLKTEKEIIFDGVENRTERPQDYVLWLACYAVAGVLGAIYAVVTQRDRWYLLLVLPLYPLYQTFMIASAWVIAAIDQARRAPMRWS